MAIGPDVEVQGLRTSCRRPVVRRWSRHSRPRVHRPSETAFAFAPWIGVRMTGTGFMPDFVEGSDEFHCHGHRSGTTSRPSGPAADRPEATSSRSRDNGRYQYQPPGGPGIPSPAARLIIQTIRRDPTGSVGIDEASNVSRPDPAGADQIDADARLRIWWSQPDRPWLSGGGREALGARLGGLPQLDRVAFGIGGAGHAPVRVGLRVGADLDCGRTELGDHGVQVANPQVQLPRLPWTPEVVGVGRERREYRRTLLLPPRPLLVGRWRRVDAEVVGVPAGQRVGVAGAGAEEQAPMPVTRSMRPLGGRVAVLWATLTPWADGASDGCGQRLASGRWLPSAVPSEGALVGCQCAGLVVLLWQGWSFSWSFRLP
jgi:hypothetical protein